MKKKKLKKEKMANQKLGNLRNLRNLRNIIPSFATSEFSICPTYEIKNLDLKISKKKFRNFRDFQGSRVFDLTYWLLEKFLVECID